MDFPKDGDGCRWNSTPHDPVTRVRFQGVGHVKVNQHRPVVGKVKTVSVKREGRKWFVVLSAEQDLPVPLPATGSVVGIDLGIANFLADSNGGFVPSARHGRRAASKLQAAQQALSRFPRCKAKDRTANHQRAVDKVAQLHGKVRRQRLDHAHCEEGVPDVLRRDTRVKVVALPRPVGAGAARNFAVNEVTAGWLTTSDDDDVLSARSLSVRLHYAQEHDLGWCAGWSADLHLDRSITTWRCSTPPGFHAPGDAWRHWAPSRIIRRWRHRPAASPGSTASTWSRCEGNRAFVGSAVPGAFPRGPQREHARGRCR
ncbi:transposase [Streptomyces canus]|uniref:transposase n=1 Tax=Streptomyces canus TaxID=58343 RepID=UPI0033BEF265